MKIEGFWFSFIAIWLCFFISWLLFGDLADEISELMTMKIKRKYSHLRLLEILT